VDVAARQDARKDPVGASKALALLDDVDEVYATRGRQVVHLDLRKSTPDRATLEGLLLGRSGTLRAPALRRGRTLIVGFDEETYRRLLR
jgi:arsenate reductase-like glutaredoxin family protein